MDELSRSDDARWPNCTQSSQVAIIAISGRIPVATRTGCGGMRREITLHGYTAQSPRGKVASGNLGGTGPLEGYRTEGQVNRSLRSECGCLDRDHGAPVGLLDLPVPTPGGIRWPPWHFAADRQRLSAGCRGVGPNPCGLRFRADHGDPAADRIRAGLPGADRACRRPRPAERSRLISDRRTNGWPPISTHECEIEALRGVTPGQSVEPAICQGLQRRSPPTGHGAQVGGPLRDP